MHFGFDANAGLILLFNLSSFAGFELLAAALSSTFTLARAVWPTGLLALCFLSVLLIRGQSVPITSTPIKLQKTFCDLGLPFVREAFT